MEEREFRSRPIKKYNYKEQQLNQMSPWDSQRPSQPEALLKI